MYHGKILSNTLVDIRRTHFIESNIIVFDTLNNSALTQLIIEPMLIRV